MTSPLGEVSKTNEIPKPEKKMNKKAVSVIIGYVLLIALAVVMGGIMYMWMKSYVPKDNFDCPDGTSLYIRNYTYDCNAKTLSLTLWNNGRFDIAGYYINAANTSTLNLATINLFNYSLPVGGATQFQGAVVISQANSNDFKPGNETTNIFDELMDNITKVELTPIRWQKKENRLRFVSCGADSKTSLDIACS